MKWIAIAIAYLIVVGILWQRFMDYVQPRDPHDDDDALSEEEWQKYCDSFVECLLKNEKFMDSIRKK